MSIFERFRAIIRNRYIAFAVLIALGVIIYSNTFHSSFVFDDHESIEESFRIRDLSNFKDVSGTRYVTNLSFAVNYSLGGLDTFGYHIVNTGIHVINSVLVFLLVSLTFKTASAGGERAEGEAIAFFSSLIFLAHPVATGAVSYLCQRYASLAALFYLLSIVLYVKARIGEGSGSRAFYALSIASAVLAQKSKEISFTLPFVIALYEFTFFDGHRGAARRLLYLAPFLLTLLIIPFEIWRTGPEAVRGAEVQGRLSMMLREELSTLSRHDYLMTQFRVLMTYLRLMVLPVNQNVDYDYPVFHSLLTPQVFISFIFLAAFLIGALYLYIRSFRKSVHGALISFGVLWFFITVSVESSVIPISDVIFEHRMYLPGAGLILAFSTLLFYVSAKSEGARRLVVVLLTAAAVAFAIAAYRRNIVWESELTVWRDAVSKSPNKARGYNNIGYALARMGRPAEAAEYFRKVTLLKPDFFGAYNNLGNSLLEAGEYDKAIAYYETAIRLKPDYWRTYANLGYALIQKGAFAESAGALETAVRLKPDYAESYAHLAYALSELKSYEEAANAMKKAIRLQPGAADYHNNLGNIYLMAGRLDDAIAEYRTAVSMDPGHENARVNLSNALSRKAPAGR